VIEVKETSKATLRSGFGRNEAYHLDTSDIQFEKKLLHVRKGKNYKERLLPIAQHLAQVCSLSFAAQRTCALL
jgi:integrase